MEGSKTKSRASDAEARKADAERVGVAGADDPSPTNVVDVPSAGRGRRRGEEEGERAAQRGVYRDGHNRRRIVGAGSIIPDGWEKVEDAPVSERDVDAPSRGAIDVEDKAERGPRGR